MKRFHKKFAPFFAALLLLSDCFAQLVPFPYETRKETTADSAMVVTAHPLATRVGVAVLRKGGNAVDAAIAVQFALAVVYPQAGNIGGGGFLIFRGKDGQVDALDYREKAPAAASEKMYLDWLVSLKAERSKYENKEIANFKSQTK